MTLKLRLTVRCNTSATSRKQLSRAATTSWLRFLMNRLKKRFSRPFKDLNLNWHANWKAKISEWSLAQTGKSKSLQLLRRSKRQMRHSSATWEKPDTLPWPHWKSWAKLFLKMMLSYWRTSSSRCLRKRRKVQTKPALRRKRKLMLDEII